MGSRPMVIIKVALQYPTQMLFSKYDHMIETLAPDRADEPFHIWTLPRTMWCIDSCHSPTELFTVYLVAISQKKSRRGLLRKCFNDLLCRPRSGRMFGHVEMRHAPAVMSKHHQYKQHPKGCRRDG